jgi:carboxyl-terminal processing protease
MHIVKSFTILISVFFVFCFCCQAEAEFGDKTYEKLKTMVDVIEIIDKNYISETKTEDLAVEAIKGMVGSLDPFSQYMEEKAYKDMKNETEGSYGGVGLRITFKDNFITIISPISGTPAYKAGILPEDRIVKINGKSAVGMTTDEAVKLMRGRAGSKVKLTLSRNNVLELIEIQLKREKIKIETVKRAVLDGKIAYIRLTEFNAQSANDIKKTLADYRKQGMKTLIFDLRNNPGGLLDSALDIVSMFVKGKVLALTTKGRNESMKKEYYTNNDGAFADLPMIVLVNRGSASASEIVSGFLQDYKRALIIGNNTFGKGSVQTVISLADGTAVRLTMAKYYLPLGDPITHSIDKKHKNGITPDIEIPVTIEQEIKLYMHDENILEKYKVLQSTAVAAYIQNNKSKKTDGKTEKNEIEDKVLDAAVKIIKENKLIEKISKLSGKRK